MQSLNPLGSGEREVLVWLVERIGAGLLDEEFGVVFGDDQGNLMGYRGHDDTPDLSTHLLGALEAAGFIRCRSQRSLRGAEVARHCRMTGSAFLAVRELSSPPDFSDVAPSRTTARPSGTVTFLFTDVVGSTQLWERFPQAMPVALAQHEAIVRKAVEERDGLVFKNVGDGVWAAFSDAAQALDAAVDAQRALQADNEGDLWPLPVRMGIHTGLVEYRLGDYHGQPLNRVARLESAGHGGQILVSLATQQLLRDGLPNGLTLRDLGDYRLKDLTHPEHVYQVVAADLPDVTTPLVIERLLRDPPKPEPSSAPLISASPELEDDSRCILTIDNTGRRAIIGATLRLVQFDSSYISTDGLPGAWRAVVHDRGRPPMESDPFCMTMDYGTVGIVEVCAVHKAVARFPVPRRDGGRVSAAPSGHLEVGLSDGGIATVEAALHLDPGYGGAQAIPLDESQSRYLLYSRRFTITRDREGEVRWGTE